MSLSWETRRRRVRARPQKANATPPPRKGRRPRWPFQPHAWSDPFTRIGWPRLVAFLFAAMTFSSWRRTEPCVNVTTLQAVVDNGSTGLKEVGFYLTVVCPVALNDLQQCLRRGVQKCCRRYTNKASEVCSNVQIILRTNRRLIKAPAPCRTCLDVQLTRLKSGHKGHLTQKRD